jgi:hypothetical protein
MLLLEMSQHDVERGGTHTAQTALAHRIVFGA